MSVKVSPFQRLLQTHSGGHPVCKRHYINHCFCLVCVPAWPWLGQGRLHVPVQARILLRHHQEHVQWQSG